MASWIEFPDRSPAANVLTNVATLLDRQLGACLHASRTPSSARSFQSPQGNSQGSLILRSGKEGSKVDFMLGSWLHSSQPFGTLDIGSLVVMANSEVDTPHLLLEVFVNTNKSNEEASLVLIHDFLPRKDLVVESEYLTRFYEESSLEQAKQRLLKSAGAEIYVSPSLSIRSVLSPSSLAFKFKSQPLEPLMSSLVLPILMETVPDWVRSLTELGRDTVNEDEKQLLERKDNQIKFNFVQTDLRSNLPALFGQEITDMLVAAYNKGE